MRVRRFRGGRGRRGHHGYISFTQRFTIQPGKRYHIKGIRLFIADIESNIWKLGAGVQRGGMHVCLSFSFTVFDLICVCQHRVHLATTQLSTFASCNQGDFVKQAGRYLKNNIHSRGDNICILHSGNLCTTLREILYHNEGDI